MLKRWLILWLLLLALPVRANVAEDDGTVQVGDPDALGSTAPVVSASASPGGVPPRSPAETIGTGGTSGGSQGSRTTGAEDPKMGQGTAQDPNGLSQDDLARRLEGPLPMENPYTLIAVGILLLLLALAGGLYFYRNRDREEPQE